jgi:hypothetical protein
VVEIFVAVVVWLPTESLPWSLVAAGLLLQSAKFVVRVLGRPWFVICACNYETDHSVQKAEAG